MADPTPELRNHPKPCLQKKREASMLLDFSKWPSNENSGLLSIRENMMPLLLKTTRSSIISDEISTI